MNRWVLACCAFLILHNISLAETTYVRNGSIGKAKQDQASTYGDDNVFRPLRELVGEKVIFLPLPKSLQKYGYQSFHDASGYGRLLSYEKAVGRIGTINSVSEYYSQKMIITMDDNGDTYIASGDDSIVGIGLVADIEAARAKYLGKTLWIIETDIETYNYDTDVITKFNEPKYSQVKVLDIVAGWYEQKPVRFIFRTSSGKEGYLDVNFTGTNVSAILRDHNRFNDTFMTEDPKKKYKWPNNVWKYIEKEHVYLGMSAEQALLSWGRPEQVNRTITGNRKYEQWVYGSGRYLYFDNGKLISIQN